MTDIHYLPIHIEVDPGHAPVEELVSLFVDISRLYRLCGGAGLCYSPENPAPGEEGL